MGVLPTLTLALLAAVRGDAELHLFGAYCLLASGAVLWVG